MTGSRFLDWLLSAGLQLQPDGRFFLPNPTAFRQTLERRVLHEADDLPALLADFDRLLSDPVELERLLQPCGAAGLQHAFAGDGLARLLLNVPRLQPHIARVLLEKVPEYEGADGGLAARILRQFRWLDVLYEGTTFIDKVLEVMDVVQGELRQDFIALLPCVVSPATQPRAVAKLLTVAEEDSGLLVACLDALGSLELDGATLDRTLALVFAKLKSIKEEALPVATKFLLQMANAGNARGVVAALRANLPLAEVGAHYLRDKGKAGAHTQATALILEALRAGLRFRKDIVGVLLRELADDQPCGPTDLLLAILAHSLGHAPHARAAEAVLRRKVAGGRLAFATVQAALELHAEALAPYFASFLAVALALVQSHGAGSAQLSFFGQQMLCAMFGYFSTTYHRQEIVATLLTLTSSTRAEEVDAGLDLLLGLTCQHFGLLRSLAPLLAGLLDDVVALPLPQARKVYAAFAVMAFGVDGGAEAPASGHGLRDELHMLVTKQVSHPEPRYKVLGFVGLAALVAYANCDPSVELRRLSLGQMAAAQGSTSEAAAVPPRPPLDQSVRAPLQRLLDHGFGAAAHAGAALPFLYDELAAAVEARGLDEGLLRGVSERLHGEFRSQYIVDLEAAECADRGPGPVPRRPFFQLEDCAVAIRVGSPGSGALTSQRWALFAMFRLMQRCERRMNGSLADLRPIVACPLYGLDVEAALDPAVFQPLPPGDRDSVLVSALFFVNWGLELLAAFADDAESAPRLLQRLRQMVRVLAGLDHALALHPSFSPDTVSGLLGLRGLSPDHRRWPGEALLLARRKASTAAGAARATQAETLQDSTLPPPDEEPRASAAKPSLTLPRLQPFLGYLRPLGGAAARALLEWAAQHPPVPWPAVHFLLRDLPGSLGAAAKTGDLRSGKNESELWLSYAPVLWRLLGHALEDRQAEPPSSSAAGDILSQDYADSSTALILTLLQQLAEGFPPGSPAALQVFTALATSCPDADKRYTLSRKHRLAAQPPPQDPAVPGDGSLWASLDRVYPEGAPPSPPVAAFCFAFQCLALTSSLEEAQRALHTLDAFARHVAAPLPAVVSDVAGQLLRQDWGGKVRPADLGGVLRLHIARAARPVAALQRVVDAVLPFLEEGKGKADNGGYATLQRATGLAYYKHLLAAAADLPAPPPPSPAGPPPAFLEDLRLQVGLFGRLATLCKRTGDVGPILVSALKSGKVFVDRFLRLTGTLGACFRDPSGAVPALLKDLQPTTRTLQLICTHDKGRPHPALAPHIPPLRRALEELLFRTKGMFVDNACVEAIQIGNLKPQQIAPARRPKKRRRDDEAPPEDDAEEGPASDGSQQAPGTLDPP